MGFVANFIRFPAMQKICENRLGFDKVTESIKVETFLRHSVAVNSQAEGKAPTRLIALLANKTVH